MLTTKSNKPSLVQATKAQSNEKIKTLLFGPCLQAQFAGMFGLKVEGIYRALRAHRSHVLPMWDWH